MTTVRRSLEAQFKADWQDVPALSNLIVVATERSLDVVNKATALIRQKGVAKCPEAPLSHRNVSILLTIISGNTNADKAQDELDELVPAVLDYLDPKWPHGDAEAVGWTGEKLAYDIPLTIRASKTPTPEEG